MPFKQKRNNSNGFNNPNFTNKQTQVSDLSSPVITDASIDTETYTAKENETRTAFEKIRSYDFEASKIDIHVAGAAPILGAKTQKVLMANSSAKGLYTGSLNNLYFNDKLRLLSTVSRKVKFKYWGQSTNWIGSPSDMTDDKKATILLQPAISTWKQNVQTLYSQLVAAMYTDLDIFKYKFQPSKINDVSNNPIDGHVTNVPLIYDQPLSYMLMQYQRDVQCVATFCAQFDYLIANLPKLQELYRSKADFFTTIQNELKRSNFLAKIRELKTWLKRRWVDKGWFKSFVLPTLVYSKATEGLNSPFNMLEPTYSIALEPVYKPGEADSPELINKIFTTGITVSRTISTDPNSQAQTAFITNIKYNGKDITTWETSLNAWSLNTIIDMIQANQTNAEFSIAFSTWIRTAENLIKQTRAESIDFATSPVVIQIEAALAKLSTAPGTSMMNWQQNISLELLLPITKYTEFEFVNELVFFQSTTPEYNNNGYTIKVPFFRNRGLSKQMVSEDFQSTYIQNDDNYISFYELDDVLTIRYRDNRQVVLKLEYNNNVYAWVPQGSYSLDQISMAFQDSFVYIFTTNDPDTTDYWTNSYFMGWITLSFQNRWAEFALMVSKNFIIPTV